MQAQHAELQGLKEEIATLVRKPTQPLFPRRAYAAEGGGGPSDPASRAAYGPRPKGREQDAPMTSKGLGAFSAGLGGVTPGGAQGEAGLGDAGLRPVTGTALATPAAAVPSGSAQPEPAA